MADRVTIMIDTDLAKEIRKRQAREIEKSNRSVSFSEMINRYLRKGLK